MKKKVLLLIMMMVLPFTFVKANEYLTADQNVSDNNSYNHSHFEAGSNVNSKSNVNGLSFVAGGVVDVEGTKEYGVFAGETVRINSIIERDLFAAGNSVSISKDASIGRDAYLAGSNITIDSNIEGNLFAAGTVVNLNNITISGDANIATGTLNIGENVNINGKLKINENVIIQGENNLRYGSKETYKEQGEINFTVTISDIILGVLTTIFTGIMLALIFPKLFRKINYDLEAKDIGKKLLHGLVTLLVIPMLIIISMILVVGMSVGVLLIMAYVIALMISSILSAAVIGHNIYTKAFKQKENIYISIIIGILAIKIVELLPVVGGIVAFLVFLYGLGIVCDLFLERNK